MDAPPDILWVTLESLRADHTPLYGYDRDTTPNLRQLAEREDATVLSNGIAASNWTRPSSASMLTGTHYSTHNTGGRGAAGTSLPGTLDTLPQLLSQAGYETALFSTARQVSDDTGLARGFDTYEDVQMEPSNFSPFGDYTLDSWRCLVSHFLKDPTLRPSELKKDVRNNNDYLLARAVERWASNRQARSDPFFAYAHIWSPHQLFLPVRRYIDEFTEDIEFDAHAAYDLAEDRYSDLASLIANGVSFSDDEWAAIKAMYDAEIRYADRTFHSVITSAQAASERDLIVVVTADHGELFGERGVVSHKIILHDGVIRVPMVVAGLEDVVDGPEMVTGHVDLSTTLADVAGVRTDQFEGRDIRSGDREYAISQRREWDFSEYREINPAFDASEYIEEPHTAVRTATHKYIESESHRILYELPEETTDVIDENEKIASELSAVIEQEGIEWFETSPQSDATFDEETRAHLRELGYMS